MVGRGVFLTVILILLASFASIGIVHAATDIGDTALHAKLAAHMLTIPAEGQEYTMDCGQSKDVVSVTPSTVPLRGDYYCVMNTSGIIIFGTFRHMGDTSSSEDISAEIISTYQDKLFNDHIAKTDIDPKGCGNYAADPNNPLFQPCKSTTIKGLNAYVYEDIDIMYVLVSTKTLSQFDSSIIDNILDWIKSFFGVEGAATTQIEVLDHFEYAYFANVAHRHISAQWYDTTAFIIYQNFSTDINSIKPEGSDYYPGHDHKQIISFKDFATTDKNILLWRKYTAGIRIADDGKNPFAGDVCGDGNVGFDEECEPGKPGDFVSCKTYNSALYTTGVLSCNPVGSAQQCMYNTTSCISCIDKDRDGYSGGQGATGALSVVSYGKFGMGIPYGPFEAFDPEVMSSTTQLVTNRKLSMHLGYEVVPITFDMAIPNGTSSDIQFTHAIALAESLYENCKQKNGGVAATEEAKLICERQAYANITTFNPAIAAEMQQIIPTPSTEALCSFKEVYNQVTSKYEGKFFCPEGETPSALGVESSIKDLFGNMKISNVNPIIKINLGKPSDIPAQGACGGTHQACSGFSATTCSVHSGCSVAQTCGGTIDDCGVFATKYICNKHNPVCSWTGTVADGFCEGNGITCDPTWNTATCTANDCVPENSCTGTTHACSTITVESSCNDLEHKGCSWNSGTGPTESKLPTKDSYTEVELRKIRGYCFVSAKGLGSYWNGIPLINNPDVKVKNFIIVGDPKMAGMSGQTYNQVYQSCRRGIKDAIGDSARALYGLPSDESFYNEYTQFILQGPSAYDGIYIEPKIICDGDCTTPDASTHKYKFADMSKADYDARYEALKETNLSITALAEISLDDPSTNYGTKQLLDLTLAKTRPLIFNKDSSGNFKTFSSFEGDEPDVTEIITNKTLYWNATIYGLQGKVVYAFKDKFVNEKNIPNSNTIRLFVADVGAHSSVVSIHNFGAATQFNLSDFNLSKCVEKGTRTISQKEIKSTAKFNGTIPANSVVTIDLGENVSCITPTTGTMAACTVRVDCNDNEDPVGKINPGAIEICGDGIDSNCDGQDSGLGCVANGNDIATDFICNYDNVCDDGENRNLCRDCAEAQDTCPKEVLFKQYPGFNVSLRADNNNNPTLHIVSKVAACKLSGGALEATYQKTGTNVGIFTNGTSSVNISYLQNNWRLEPKGDIVKQLKPCWGSMTTVDITFVSVPVCVPGTGSGSCIDDTDCNLDGGTRFSCVDGVCELKIGTCNCEPNEYCFKRVCYPNEGNCGGYGQPLCYN